MKNMDKERIKQIIYNMRNNVREELENGRTVQWGNDLPMELILEAILED
jgi:hypothetical protein